MNRLSRQKLFTSISILIIVPIGFYSKFYSGPNAFWVNNSLGGVFYEIFWCLVIFLLLPNIIPWRIALVVFIVTCGLEFLQLWHPPFLQLLRGNFLGRSILGNSFTWSDFPYYVAGSVLGFFWIEILKIKK
jgi:hypothetical protein